MQAKNVSIKTCLYAEFAFFGALNQYLRGASHCFMCDHVWDMCLDATLEWWETSSNIASGFLRLFECLRVSHESSATGLERMPMPSISISTISPGFIQTGGVRA